MDGVRQNADIHRLDHRLEALEARLKAAATANANEPPPKHNNPTESPQVNLESETANDGLLYRMVSGAKDSIESLTTRSSEPSSPWAQSTVSSAITRLDTALVQLAAPFPRPGNHVANEPKVNLPRHEAKQCIDIFLDFILPHATVFVSFNSIVDPEFLRALPHIIDSPYADVKPVMRVIYHCAIYLGQSLAADDQHRKASKTYYTCLQSVPKWLESAEGTKLDILAAALTTWLAINNFDYHLAWQFHREACRFGDLLDIHSVDFSPLGTPQEEADKEVKRRLHWYLVEIDFLFRLWYDKPRALRCDPTQVRLPAEISPATKQPKPHDCILFIVWTRALYIIADYFKARETLTEEALISNVDDYCNQLTELVDDWDMLSVARSPKVNMVQSWLYAESTIAFHSMIIYMRRKASATVLSTHPQAIRSARAIISILDEWSQRNIAPGGEPQSSYILLITFYPFCAFFTLYYHILSSDDPKEREEDISSLEKVIKLMTQASNIRPDFVPIASAMGALNDVSRAVHSGEEPPQGLAVVGAVRPRQSMEPNLLASGAREIAMQAPSQRPQEIPTGSAPAFPPFESLQNLSMDLPLQTADQLNDAFGVPFQLGSQVAIERDPASSARPGTARMVSQPVDFVRAIETELIWRDWHESWWSIPDTSQADQAGNMG
ncbi:fungal specific transcription factor domain-containing protein [Aspergillus mulundensis]|uniref:Transcription factor domain-containing protein n=1 Tax=Aspergillus mulundensis TaxID=1810919 RepID=A0A3D8R3Z6_9EURO|nr:Uncharacterized protein DSM5745_08466 [Aspergillus mulundensis]RDW68706.1 Uncharacterized protein DSM5745_08466 [Aspergillus mulundensis]